MKETIDSIKFNLTSSMLEKLIEFNNLKKELNCLKNNNILETKKIKNIETKLNKLRIEFIKEFRLNNKEEILRYLKKQEISKK